MAGGKSSRMGQDKLFLKIGEETFIEHLYHNGEKVFDRIYISTDTQEHADRIKSLPAFQELSDDRIILDAFPRCGPIGGICSVFDHSDIDKFAVVPTDVPCANVRVLGVLLLLCHEKPCIYRRDNGYIEPLIGAYDKSCYDVFRGCLDKGKFSIHKALENNGFKTFSAKELVGIEPALTNVDFKNEFFNVNFPEDYNELIR